MGKVRTSGNGSQRSSGVAAAERVGATVPPTFWCLRRDLYHSPEDQTVVAEIRQHFGSHGECLGVASPDGETVSLVVSGSVNLQVPAGLMVQVKGAKPSFSA